MAITERPVIDVEKCDGCGICVDVCDGIGFKLVDGKAVAVSTSNCDFCSVCEAACPTGAIACFFEVVLEEGTAPGP